MLGGRSGDDRLRAIATSGSQGIGAASDRRLDKLAEVVARPQLHRLDAAPAGLLVEVGALGLAAPGLRIPEDDGVLRAGRSGKIGRGREGRPAAASAKATATTTATPGIGCSELASTAARATTSAVPNASPAHRRTRMCAAAHHAAATRPAASTAIKVRGGTRQRR